MYDFFTLFPQSKQIEFLFNGIFHLPVPVEQMWILSITVNIKDYFPSISKPNLKSLMSPLSTVSSWLRHRATEAGGGSSAAASVPPVLGS